MTLFELSEFLKNYNSRTCEHKYTGDYTYGQYRPKSWGTPMTHHLIIPYHEELRAFLDQSAAGEWADPTMPGFNYTSGVYMIPATCDLL